ncbi:unnamed protein product [Rhizoctonia solani]|uniref:Uncharacterized protein n=1 Tax=Rhizoctonia solani TaxID=456999 RepID=A0A8H3HF47_9AGAM|nr:unnamed protein product [Rhizoctonia solani]
MAVVEISQQSETGYLTVTYNPPGQGTTVQAAAIPLSKNYGKETEFRLCEDHQNVGLLPLGGDRDITYKLKLIVIGEMSVGKSMMFEYFTKLKKDRSTELSPTLGARSDISTRFITAQSARLRVELWDTGTTGTELSPTLGARSDISTRFITAQSARLRVELWDTAGQEKFRSVIKGHYRGANYGSSYGIPCKTSTSHYRGANGALLVYNVTNTLSFSACKAWLKDLRNETNEDAPIMLVGNQIDLSDLREVGTSEGKKFADDNNLLFAEISAKEGTGVDNAFHTLVNEVFNQLKKHNKLSEYDTSKRARTVELNAQDEKDRSYLSIWVSSAYDAGAYLYHFESTFLTMVDTRQLQEPSEGDPLGAASAAASGPERPQPSHTPSLPPYSPALGKARLLTVTYIPPGDSEATSHTALIPWTNDYETALLSAKEAFEPYFPPGSAQRRRWLTTRVQTSSGVTWAEFRTVLFSQVVGEPGVELRLCEDRPPKLDVTVLPIGHEQTTAEGDSYYQFKIITVGQRNVGKSMSEHSWSTIRKNRDSVVVMRTVLQYFTKPEEARLSTLSSTVGPSMDIANRFMTAHGELVKTVLWDTAGQEAFRAMTKPLYRGVHGVFLVYSIADAESFNNCPEWLTEIRAHVDENVPIMLIGNQIDRTEGRAVETSDAQAFAIEHKLLFAEISGMYGTNVETAFQKLVHGEC